jgi:ribosomal protein S18 acetylase RimI-like enzyme
VLLRRATASDAQAIGAVFDAAVRAGWTFLGEIAERRMFTPQQWDDLVENFAPPNALLVATDGSDEIIGFTAVDTAAGEMFLLFVDPEHGGRGVGRLLLDAAHAALREAGRDEVFLYAEERNERARAVYEAAGYRHDGTARESDFHGAALRELRLVKRL